jgi:hypothetical protein
MFTIESLKKLRNSQIMNGFAGIDGYTPIDLVIDQVEKIPIDYSNPNLKFNIPAAGHGTYAIVVFWKLFYGLSEIFIEEEERSGHILKNMLYLNEINSWHCRQLLKQGFLNVYHGDFLKYETDMKFDVSLGNDPYQEKVGPNKTEPLWNKFFFKRMSLLKEGGYLSLIHPSGWRNIDGKYKNVQEEIKSKNLKFLSINSVEDGQKLFNATTPFDWYVLQNKEYEGVTAIKFQDGTIGQTDISNLEFIPNGSFDTVVSLISQGDKETVEVLYSRSDYGTDKQNVSKTQSDEFPYPVVYSVLSDGTVNFMYSSTDQKGHFGIPKLILGNGANPTCFIDYDGDYGMTQFAYGIVDTVENLEKIKDVISSDRFQKVNLATKYVATAGNPLVYPKILKTFRKDFWKEFIDE